MEKSFKEHTLVIGFCGHAKAGKDTAFAGIEEECFKLIPIKYHKLAFADPIREIGRTFGFSQEEMTDQSLKEKTNEFWDITPRKFMQLVGSEMFRNVFRKDCWIKLAEKKILDFKKECESYVDSLKKQKAYLPGIHQIIIISDVRFENEAKMIKDSGGFIFKIRRDNGDQASSIGVKNHESEAAIDKIQFDLLIDNDCASAEEFQLKAAQRFWDFIHMINPPNQQEWYRYRAAIRAARNTPQN